MEHWKGNGPLYFGPEFTKSFRWNYYLEHFATTYLLYVYHGHEEQDSTLLVSGLLMYIERVV